MRPETEMVLRWISNGMTEPWGRWSTLDYVASLVDQCLRGEEPDWRSVKAALEVYAADPAISHHLRKFTTACDMDMRAGRRAYLAGYAQHLRAFRRRQLDAALRYVIANEPEELDTPLGIGYTGMSTEERREWRGES